MHRLRNSARDVTRMIETILYVDDLQKPISLLEEIFRSSGLSLIQAAFRHSFFLDPEKVRTKTPRFPGFVRHSRTHYHGKNKGDYGKWRDGRRVRLESNARAQMAWAWYSGRKIARASGYGVRHVWGHPWDPDAYTAGWNLCYMPFWVGMLTEDQHPHPDLQLAIKQASYDLYFRKNPVCTPPTFVKDPGLDLKKILGDQPILLLGKAKSKVAAAPGAVAPTSPDLRIVEIRVATHQSWSNLAKAIEVLQGKTGVKFGTPHVASSSKSVVKRMLRETGWQPKALKQFIEARIAVSQVTRHSS